jgi:hypothetical protein
VKADVPEATDPNGCGQDWESFEIILHDESTQACKEQMGFRLVASHHGWFTGEEKDHSFYKRLVEYSAPSDEKTGDMSSEKDALPEHQNDESKESLPKDSTKQRNNSYSCSPLQKHRDFADSFSTTDDDWTEQQHSSYSHSRVQQNRNSADGFIMTDGCSTKQRNDPYSHSLVPRNTDFAESSAATDDDAPTTLMIRNIPNQYAQKDFGELIDSLGLKGTYDFLYLPMDKRTNGNVGYCFINFIDHHWAAKCVEVRPTC